VDEHRGEIEIENRPERGACVRVYLPAMRGSDAVAKAA